PGPLREGRVTTVRFTPDGRQLLVGRADGRLLLWDFAEKRERWHVPPLATPDENPECKSLAFSPDATRWAVGDRGGRVRVGRTDTGQVDFMFSVPDSSA